LEGLNFVTGGDGQIAKAIIKGAEKPGMPLFLSENPRRSFLFLLRLF
jgi:type III secretion system FlhB-like substrate exporter